MKVFEFYFNPRIKKNRLFKSFSSEKQRGLYLIGELSNVIPQNPKNRMKHALSRGNEFLLKESKKGNTDWLGNIHCIVLLLSTPRKGLPEILFAKIGVMNISLAREKRIIDIEKQVASSVQLHHVKAFGNVVSGKLLPGDKIFISTKDLFLAFQKEKLLKECIEAKDNIQLKNLFQTKQKQLKTVQGVLFVAFLETRLKQNDLSLLTLPNFSEKYFLFLKPPTLPIKMSKNMAFSFVFIFLLLGGMIFLRGEQLFFNKEAQQIKKAIEELRQQAKNSLLENDQKNSFLLLMQALDLASSKTLSGKEMQSLKKVVEEELRLISHVQEIADPQIVAEVPAQEIALIPQHMVLAKNILYFTNPSSQNIYAINIQTNERQLFKEDGNITLGYPLFESALFLKESNKILQFTGSLRQEKTLENPYPDFRPTAMATFEGNVYFWDSQVQQIVRYSLSQSPALQAHAWLNPQSAKKPNSEHTQIPFAIDRNIWMVSKGNEIERYFAGFYQETLPSLIFPKFEDISEIYTKTDLSSLFIIEASQKRVVEISKNGLVLKQYESPHFDNLLSIQVSPDGKTIYLLNGTKVFKIDT